MSTLQRWLAVLGLLVVIALGAALGWWLRGLFQPADLVPEVVAHAHAQRLDDGALVVERKPVAKPPPPPHRIPKGWVEERRVTATVEPERPGPVQLNLSVVRDDAGGRRAIVSSPDGPVIAAADVPIERGMVPAREYEWAAGASHALADDRWGLWLDRDIGRVRIGASVSESRDSARPEFWFRAGVRF